MKINYKSVYKFAPIAEAKKVITIFIEVYLNLTSSKVLKQLRETGEVFLCLGFQFTLSRDYRQ